MKDDGGRVAAAQSALNMAYISLRSINGSTFRQLFDSDIYVRFITLV